MDDFLADDDFDKAASVYKEKYNSLNTTGQIFVKRATEWERRPKLLETFKKLLNSIEKFASEIEGSEEFGHIQKDNELLKELMTKLAEASTWHDEKSNQHAKTKKNE